MKRVRNRSFECSYCGRRYPSRSFCRRCRVTNLRRLAQQVEEGKRLIRQAIAHDAEKVGVWDGLSSQRKKLAVFQCWDNGWIYWSITGSNKVVSALNKHFKA